KADYEKVEQMMNLLDIAKFAKRNAYELSGGEFGRVLIARALVSEPHILLLDEPTSALDLNYALNIMKICKKLTSELNLLSIMVIHDLNLAGLFCDKVFMLRNGKIRYQGAPKELYTKEILHEIYDLECEILYHKNDPFIVLSKD
ncbi:MAG: ABC transporter ATP-binding protein, partial [Campylobacter sp.]|nr:ABC transporter ATP-binding protein [Campylobacter sp.]